MFVMLESTHEKILEEIAESHKVEVDNLKVEVDNLKAEVSSARTSIEQLEAQLVEKELEIETLRSNKTSVTFEFSGPEYDILTPKFQYTNDFANYLDQSGTISDSSNSKEVELALIMMANEASDTVIENFTPDVQE